MISALNRIIKQPYFFTTAFILIGIILWGLTPRMIQTSGPIFGTQFKVVVIASRLSISQYQLDQLVQSELQRINEIFSTYSERSELSRVNQKKTTMPIKLSKELYQFFEQSAIWYHKLNGAWDPTLAPLSQFYGLQPSNLTMTKANALQQIGFDNVRILEPQHIQKKIDGLTFDFSSNAKGYAVDQLMAQIKQYKVQGVFVDIGGEISTDGHKENQEPWRVGIQSPIIGDQPLTIIEGHRMALASSGNYLNHVNGVGHILDPRKKAPITHNLMAVTIMADNCFIADIIATGLFVMGPEEASKWLTVHSQYPAMLVVKDTHGHKSVIYFNGFKRLKNT